jgi:hypothetical protein
MVARWGCRIARENEVPVYVQSTREGYQTYKKYGFKKVFATDMDLKQFGKEGTYCTFFLARLHDTLERGEPKLREWQTG